MASTLTLQNVVDFARANTRLIPIVGVGGLGQEPALSICNDTLQEVLSSPYAWRFNRASIPPFTTFNYQQDYYVTGATVSFVSPTNNGTSGGIFPIQLAPTGITVSGTTATLNTTAQHNIANGASVTIAGCVDPNFNHTFTVTAVPSNSSIQFTVPAGLSGSGAPGITNIGWLERCVLQDYANTSPVKPLHNIEVVATLMLESIIQPPFKIAYEGEQQPGVIIFRTWPVPSSQIWNVFIDYQVKPPIKTSISQNWAPWPDEFGFVLRQGFLAKALVFAEDPRAQAEMQKWQMVIGKMLDIKDQEMRSESFFPERPVMYGG